MTLRTRRVRTIRRRMSFAAFDRRPRQLGWKYEYYDGKAAIYPARVFIPFEMELTKRPENDGSWVRPATVNDLGELQKGFHDAFRHAPEYADYPNARYADEVEKYFHDFFHALRGLPLPASTVALVDGNAIGAAMIVRTKNGPLLDCVFVRPEFARSGWATAVVSRAVNALLQSGESRLRSFAMQANEPSIRWHLRFGFRELPDLYVARHRYRFYHAEYERHQQRNDLADDELERLLKQVESWYHETDRLDEERFQVYLNAMKAAEITR